MKTEERCDSPVTHLYLTACVDDGDCNGLQVQQMFSRSTVALLSSLLSSSPSSSV